jgi:dGTPase
LKVAQVGRRLAEYLQSGDSPDIPSGVEINEEVVETAALAHDIGHPPFGHVAEKELDRKIREEKGIHDGFEGNAQSFRVITKVANHDGVKRGLNLTLASINALLKYPWQRGEDGNGKNQWEVDEYKKWGYYGSEKDVFEEVRNLSGVKKKRSRHNGLG